MRDGDYVAVMDADIVDGARDFRLMRREMVDAIVEMSEYNRFSIGDEQGRNGAGEIVFA